MARKKKVIGSNKSRKDIGDHKSQGKTRDQGTIVDAGNREMEKFVPSTEVQNEFREAGRLGVEPSAQLAGEAQGREAEPPSMAVGDFDADLTGDAGEETAGGENPTPDQTVVEEIGEALGLTYEDNEPLRPNEKIARRDRKRWELNPASSEGFNERTKDEGGNEAE